MSSKAHALLGGSSVKGSPASQKCFRQKCDLYGSTGRAFPPAACLPTNAQPTPETLVAVREGVNPFGFHAMEFNDYAMVLSDPQLELLASNLGLADTSHDALHTYFRGQLPKRFASFMNDFMRAPMSKYPALKTHPCAWNMLLRRRCVVQSVCVFRSIYCVRSYPFSSLALRCIQGHIVASCLLSPPRHVPWAFIVTRVPQFLPSVARVELCLPTLYIEQALSTVGAI